MKNNYLVENLTINLSMRCNMRCLYCYVFSQEISDEQKNIDMTLGTVEKILMQYSEMVDKEKRILDITWHGGEPLIMGVDFFEDIMSIQKRLYEEKGIIVRNRLQTNGTLIDKRWIDFFQKYKFAIGISLDGPEIVHSKYRFFFQIRYPHLMKP